MKKVPNILTLFRFLLFPVFVLTFIYVEDKRAAFFVYFFACLLDLLDGYIARKYDAVTDWGKVMDPLADKFMQVSAFICLAASGYFPYFAAIIVVAKESVMVIGGIFLYNKKNRVVYSNFFGKAAALFLNMVVCALFFEQTCFKSEQAIFILDILVYVAVGLSVISMLQYGFFNYLRPYILKKGKYAVK